MTRCDCDSVALVECPKGAELVEQCWRAKREVPHDVGGHLRIGNKQDVLVLGVGMIYSRPWSAEVC